MVCPYCKKTISVNTSFCPECGQDISNKTQQSQSDAYWKNVNIEDAARSKEYKSIIAKSKQEATSRRNKKLITTAIILVLMVVISLGIFKYQQYQSQMVDEVKEGLVGETFTAHSTHMEGLGWIHHEYWQLKFVDEESLEYSYIQTVGPAEDDEIPKYQGTYSYTVSRSITGKYTVRVNGASYELKVNDENVPRGISRK